MGSGPLVGSERGRGLSTTGWVIWTRGLGGSQAMWGLFLELNLSVTIPAWARSDRRLTGSGPKWDDIRPCQRPDATSPG
jgi:hypothetical protein